MTVVVRPATDADELTVVVKPFTIAVKFVTEFVSPVVLVVNPFRSSDNPLTSLIEIGKETEPDAPVRLVPPPPPEPLPLPAPEPEPPEPEEPVLPPLPEPSVVDLRTALKVSAVVLGGTCQVSVQVTVPFELL